MRPIRSHAEGKVAARAVIRWRAAGPYMRFDWEVARPRRADRARPRKTRTEGLWVDLSMRSSGRPADSSLCQLSSGIGASFGERSGKETQYAESLKYQTWTRGLLIRRKIARGAHA